jgi:hypothetical protein
MKLVTNYCTEKEGLNLASNKKFKNEKLIFFYRLREKRAGTQQNNFYCNFFWSKDLVNLKKTNFHKKISGNSPKNNFVHFLMSECVFCPYR